MPIDLSAIKPAKGVGFKDKAMPGITQDNAACVLGPA